MTNISKTNLRDVLEKMYNREKMYSRKVSVVDIMEAFREAMGLLEKCHYALDWHSEDREMVAILESHGIGGDK